MVAPFPGSSPAICCILYNKWGDCGPFDHMRDDVLCVNWVIELQPMHAVLECLTMLDIETESLVDCHSA